MTTKQILEIIDRQLTSEQIEALDELARALWKFDHTDIYRAFNPEAPDYDAFDICWEDNELMNRIYDLFEDYDEIEQLDPVEDYATCLDDYDSEEEEEKAEAKLIDKIQNWRDAVDKFINTIDDNF